MSTVIDPLEPEEEPVLRHLAQLYAYDFAEIMGWDLPASGRFPDDIVDGCFSREGRHGFLVRAGGRLAGFAIVDSCSRLTGEAGVHDMAEFFIARTARGRGIGAEAACALFDRFGGRWEVRQTERNQAALAFWRKVIGRYTAGRFVESVLDTERWRGTVHAFTCPRSGDTR